MHLGAEQLEKAREIIKRLNEEKKKLAEELKTRVEMTEKTSDEEREALMLELKRGKAAALELMQVSTTYVDYYSWAKKAETMRGIT